MAEASRKSILTPDEAHAIISLVFAFNLTKAGAALEEHLTKRQIKTLRGFVK